MQLQVKLEQSPGPRARIARRSKLSPMNKQNKVLINIGVDVSKHHLDIYLLPQQTTFRILNTKEGIRQGIKQLKTYSIERLLVEATGRMEDNFIHACRKASFPVILVNPTRIRRFAQSMGIHAKTDPLDAQVIALFAETIKPEIRPLENEITIQCNDLMIRRRQLLELRTMEKNRLGIMPEMLHKSIHAVIDCYNQQLAALEKTLKERVKQNVQWQQQLTLLQTVPGVGETLSMTLLSQLPELGQLSRKEIASLVGVAPMNRDSGHYRGERHIRGGRASIRKVLYMAVVAAIRCNTIIRHTYQKLRAKGKKAKVAIVACMRKLIVILNAMVRDGQPWQMN